MSRLRILLISTIAFEGQPSAAVSRYPNGHYCRSSLDDRQCTRITFKVPKDGSKPVIDVSDEASGVKEKDVQYKTEEILSYDYYHIRLTNGELIKKLGPVEVDSITSLGTPKGTFNYLSPKFKEGRDTRLYRNNLCPEARSIEPVIPKALSIRTHHPHMPQGSYCARWTKENIFLKLEFVGGGKPTLNVYELSSNKFEMNAHYDTDVLPVVSVQDMWGLKIKLKAQDLIKAVGTEKLKVLQQLYYSAKLKHGRDHFTHYSLHSRPTFFRPSNCP